MGVAESASFDTVDETTRTNHYEVYPLEVVEHAALDELRLDVRVNALVDDRLRPPNARIVVTLDIVDRVPVHWFDERDRGVVAEVAATDANVVDLRDCEL